MTRTARFQSAAHAWGSSVEYGHTEDRNTTSSGENGFTTITGTVRPHKVPDGPHVCTSRNPTAQGLPPAAASRWAVESEPDRRVASCAHGTIEQKNLFQKIIWAIGLRKTALCHPQHSFSKFLGGSMPASQKFTIDISVRYAIIRTYIRRTLVLSCKGQEAS